MSAGPPEHFITEGVRVGTLFEIFLKTFTCSTDLNALE